MKVSSHQSTSCLYLKSLLLWITTVYVRLQCLVLHYFCNKHENYLSWPSNKIIAKIYKTLRTPFQNGMRYFKGLSDNPTIHDDKMFYCFKAVVAWAQLIDPFVTVRKLRPVLTLQFGIQSVCKAVINDLIRWRNCITFDKPKKRMCTVFLLVCQDYGPLLENYRCSLEDGP